MKDKSPTTFCPECRKNVTYTITEENMKSRIKEEEYSYKGKVARCDNCGSELYLGDINDDNLERLYSEYQNRHPEWHMPSGWQDE